MTDPIQLVESVQDQNSTGQLVNIDALFNRGGLLPEVATDSSNPAPESVVDGESPLSGQYREPHLVHHEPVQLIFLDGPNKGESLDLGICVTGMSQSQSAQWQEDGAKGIVQGLNFDSASPRQFNFTVTFFDINQNVIHLVESLFWMLKIDPDSDGHPPSMLMVIGQTNIESLVCLTIDPKYDEPMGGQKGFRQCKVDLSFKLKAGKDSKHLLSSPLAPNPMSDRLATITQTEAERQGAQSVAQLLLQECLGEEHSDALNAIIEHQQLSNPEALLSLPNQVFVHAAIGGLISPELLAQSDIQRKLEAALAQQIAETTRGINLNQLQLFQNALQTGSTGGLKDPLVTEVERLAPHYREILEAVKTQDLDSLQDSSNPASETFIRAGSCGISMRQVGADIFNLDLDNNSSLGDLNNFLGADPAPSNKDIRDRMGKALSNQEIKALRNGVPYNSREQFVEHMSSANSALTGYSLWSNFAKSGKNQDELTL